MINNDLFNKAYLKAIFNESEDIENNEVDTNKEEEQKELNKEGIGTLAGAGIGAAVGGPIGAVAGGALGSSLDKEQKEITPPIDDLTKENTAVLEDASDSTEETEGETTTEEGETAAKGEEQSQEEQPEVEATLSSEEDESEESEFEEDEDGWGDEVREQLELIISDGEDLFYEIKNCVRGSFTNCNTKSELADYLREYAENIIQVANEL